MTDSLQSRLVALEILQKVLYQKQNLDDVLEKTCALLSSTDRSFVRMLITTTLRRMGQIDEIISFFLEKKLPLKAKPVQEILRLGVCQIVFMKTPDFASVSTSVDLAKKVEKTAYYKLVNAVLRGVSRGGFELPAVRENTPEWLKMSWQKAYGKENTEKILEALLSEPYNYITVKEDPLFWAQKVDGEVTATESVRLPAGVYVPDLEGFKEGAWWVQDAGASLAVKAFSSLKQKRVADLCCAPGGKTASLICAGASVDAFDVSAKRMERVQENLSRLNLQAHLEVKDANKIEGEKIYDAILIDAPCSATGTLMRHPDIYFHRSPEDIAQLNEAQYKLLQTAYRLLKDEGEVVYCTCSLQQEEGEKMIERVQDLFERVPIANPLLQPFLTKKGDVRTFPYQQMDGFFVALLKKSCK